MTSKVISFQVVQGFEGESRIFWPCVVALCEDGSLWKRTTDGDGDRAWLRFTPELQVSTQTAVWNPHTNSVI